jgi:hypothetical protein
MDYLGFRNRCFYDYRDVGGIKMATQKLKSKHHWLKRLSNFAISTCDRFLFFLAGILCTVIGLIVIGVIGIS